MDAKQARSDEKDNRRVFTWVICTAVIVMLGALAYFYAVDKRGEAPAAAGSTTAAPSAAPSASPAPAAPAAPQK